MKNYIGIIACSLCSAILAVFLYDQFSEPRKLIIKESIPVSYATDKSPYFNADELKAFGQPSNFINSAKISTPCVVFIRSTENSDYRFWRADQYGHSTGSGVVVSDDGYIVTNKHVVDGGNTIQVILNDKREFIARLVGSDPMTDLALLKIEEENLSFLRFADSDSIGIGEWVLAVGNPFRLQSTVTAGIVSAKGRNINILDRESGIESFIQTDAAINPGNSGGALVNTSGKLIGINTAIITKSGRYEGYSFAIPSNIVQKVINDLKEYGAVQRGWLGVDILTVNDELAKRYKLPQVKGVLINRVNPNSAAFDAGLVEGDVIVSINNKSTGSSPEFMEQMGVLRPGDVINVEYFRNGKISIAQVILKNQINTTELIATRKDRILTDLGFELRDLSAQEKNKFRKDGVLVTSIYRGSTIERTNMDPDYIITHINTDPINNVDQFVDKLENSKGVILLEGFYERYEGKYPYAFHK